MRIEASGRSALILATGLWMCCAGPSQAARTADTKAPVTHAKYARHVAHHWKKFAHRKHGKLGLKSARTRQADEDNEATASLPPAVANANAQLASADTSTGGAMAMSARASAILQSAPADAQVATGLQLVSADQLNEVDRALHGSAPPVPPAAIPPERPAPPVMANRSDNSIWDKTSLIGKIFMAFGVMLTMASAARMFMA